MPAYLPPQWFVVVEALTAKGWHEVQNDIPTVWWSLYQVSFVRHEQQVVLSLLTEPWSDETRPHAWAIGASRTIPTDRAAAAVLGSLTLGRGWQQSVTAFIGLFS
ncbi:hypothetical protein [Deinococcus humi]|uniref:Uncharacterized protein n=1 Tax=Deinococcus humi TaxID=662880 RepID=A0A7W8JUV4_9DEIO|nr:hypothetical protein [Deinococcus humi]MBB5363591.1 hypothetical protein [Deinococcus humi]